MKLRFLFSLLMLFTPLKLKCDEALPIESEEKGEYEVILKEELPKTEGKKSKGLRISEKNLLIIHQLDQLLGEEEIPLEEFSE